MQFDKTWRLAVIAVGASLFAGSASASDVTSVKRTLSFEGAKKVAAAAEAEARKAGAGGAIAVVDDGGHALVVLRLDGTFAAASNVSLGKARTAALFRRPTKVFEKLINEGRTTMVTLPDFTPLQGGVPIIVDGQVVGAVGVSGAASAQADEEIAVAAAAALDAPMTSSMSMESEVFFLESARVAAAFREGAPLVEVSEYKVHASHREGAGEAEVHAEETDVIYVLEGGATLVTGGSVVAPRSTAPGETRGSGIDGGETRRLRKGDVVIVPRGVPHWFEKVDGKIDYYVVKVL